MPTGQFLYSHLSAPISQKLTRWVIPKTGTLRNCRRRYVIRLNVCGQKIIHRIAEIMKHISCFGRICRTTRRATGYRLTAVGMSRAVSALSRYQYRIRIKANIRQFKYCWRCCFRAYALGSRCVYAASRFKIQNITLTGSFGTAAYFPGPKQSE